MKNSGFLPAGSGLCGLLENLWFRSPRFGDAKFFFSIHDLATNWFSRG